MAIVTKDSLRRTQCRERQSLQLKRAIDTKERSRVVDFKVGAPISISLGTNIVVSGKVDSSKDRGSINGQTVIHTKGNSNPIYRMVREHLD
jgi:hypothetical protein